ncbi:hypothetical protein ACM66B_003714 [Microbotryomycetes sp. NB124-2]
MKARTRDFVYIAFLVVHIPATLLVDLHALPGTSNIVPRSWRIVYDIAHKDDPLLQAASSPMFAWFQSFLLLELVFQLPTFFVGAWALWQNKRTIYPLLTIYGASTATTTLACLATLLQLPGLGRQRLIELLAMYVPFMLVPLCMAVDFGARTTAIIRRVDASETPKSKAE